MGRARVTREASRAAPARCLGVFVVALAVGCSTSPPRPNAAHAITPATAASNDGEVFSFPASAASPLDVTEVRSELEPFLAHCRGGDAALARVAERFARRQSNGQAPLDVSEISFALRAEGSPYVWPRAWTLEGGDLLTSTAQARMHDWLASWSDGGERRCGMALVESSDRSVLAAVAVDALADLDPLPVRVQSGAWISFSARMLVPASEAKVIVLGPNGGPHAVPTSFDGRTARARFRADRAGAFVVQLLANVEGGPRPVLESSVYADVRPPTTYFGDAAPGESSGAGHADQEEALLAMVNAARQAEQSPALVRDAALDAVAERHAEAMRKLKRIAHDAGDGLPPARVEAAGIEVLAFGENVAHALDVRRAHRALWASPSHRENLLQPRFDRVGIGIAVDPDGSIWVCEVFADSPDAE
jgi:uncharacterized protein YkwD